MPQRNSQSAWMRLQETRNEIPSNIAEQHNSCSCCIRRRHTWTLRCRVHKPADQVLDGLRNACPVQFSRLLNCLSICIKRAVDDPDNHEQGHHVHCSWQSQASNHQAGICKRSPVRSGRVHIHRRTPVQRFRGLSYLPVLQGRKMVPCRNRQRAQCDIRFKNTGCDHWR